MKKTLLILSLFASVTLFGQSIPNGGFENWNITTWQNPQYYGTSNGNNNGGGVVTVNVTRTTSAFHGSYAVQMTALKVGADSIGGYVIDGNPNGSSVQGGIPYNQMATGISLHYKLTIKAKDTALVLVFFKSGGAVIGQYLLKVYDTTSTYKLFSATFSPALAITPDTVVFGAATSIRIVNNGNGMPGTVFTIDSVNFTGGVTQPAELNGDFENWSVNDTLLTPVSWESAYNTPGFFRTTDAASGNYALELVTEPPMQNYNQVSSGEADDGYDVQVNSHHDSIEGGYPFAMQMDSLEFDYKYAPHDTADRASINLTFKKSGKVISGQGWLLNASASYKHMVVGFNAGAVPDTVLIQMESSNIFVFDSTTMNYQTPDTCIGADLKVDNLNFQSEITGITTIIKTNEGIHVYPNPAMTVLNLQFMEVSNTNAIIRVMDATGKVVLTTSADVNSGKVLPIDISSLASGMYFVRVITDNRITVLKFVKE